MKDWSNILLQIFLNLQFPHHPLLSFHNVNLLSPWKSPWQQLLGNFAGEISKATGIQLD